MALIDTNAAALAALVDKTTGDTLTAAEYTSLKDALQEANAATRTANTILAGPTTGAAAATFRALVAADIPSLSYQPVDATLTALAALGAGPGFLQVTGQDAFSIAALSGAQINTALGYTAANAAALNASNLTSGTIPDARFPAVLPAISGANLTNLPGGISGLTAGVIPVATSGTVIVNSKITASGTNLGTFTVDDDTPVTGAARVHIKAGAGQGTTVPFAVDALDGDPTCLEVKWGAPHGMTGMVIHSRTPGAGDYPLTIQGSVIETNIGPTGYFAIARAGIGGVWAVDTANAWLPGASNTYDIGTPTARVRKIHAATSGVQTANGAESNVKTISESITLATGGLTTDSTADLLPANSIILSVVARITTTITTTTDWALGDATTAARFAAPNATLTAGTTAVGLAHQQGGVATDAAGPVQIAAAKLRITCSGANPGAGAVRVTVTYLELTPPTS